LRQDLGITKGIKAPSRDAILETLPPWGGVSLCIIRMIILPPLIQEEGWGGVEKQDSPLIPLLKKRGKIPIGR